MPNRNLRKKNLNKLKKTGGASANKPLDKTDECSICLAPLYIFVRGSDEIIQNLNDIAFINNCKHLFHKECIQRWFNGGRSSCPNCRQQGTELKDVILKKDVILTLIEKPQERPERAPAPVPDEALPPPGHDQAPDQVLPPALRATPAEIARNRRRTRAALARGLVPAQAPAHVYRPLPVGENITYNDLNIRPDFDREYLERVRELNEQNRERIGLYSNNIIYDKSIFDTMIVVNRRGRFDSRIRDDPNRRLLIHILSLLDRTFLPADRPYLNRDLVANYSGSIRRVNLINWLLNNHQQLRENYYQPFNIPSLNFTEDEERTIIEIISNDSQEPVQRGGKKSNKRKSNKNKKSRKSKKAKKSNKARKSNRK